VVTGNSLVMVNKHIDGLKKIASGIHKIIAITVHLNKHAK
jgi:hypothetical protein